MTDGHNKKDDDYRNGKNNNIIQINKYNVTKKNLRNIDVEIDEIIFYGIDRLERNSIASAIEQDLSLLLSNYSASIQLDDSDRINNKAMNKRLRQNVQKESIIDAYSFSISLGKKIDSKSIGTEISQSIFKILASTNMTDKNYLTE